MYSIICSPYVLHPPMYIIFIYSHYMYIVIIYRYYIYIYIYAYTTLIACNNRPDTNATLCTSELNFDRTADTNQNAPKDNRFVLSTSLHIPSTFRSFTFEQSSITFLPLFLRFYCPEYCILFDTLIIYRL